MGIPKQIDAQRDFSAGEIDPTAKRRDDDDFVKKGMRQLSNGRTLNTGGVTNRPGRNLLAKRAAPSRDEDVTMAPGTVFRLSFTAGTLTVYNAAGTQVFTSAVFPWLLNNLNQISYAIYLKQIFIAFPGMVPRVVSWDGVSTWGVAQYAETISTGGQKRTAFYRLSPKGVGMQPSATTGAVVLDFTGAIPGIISGKIAIGSFLRYCGRQMQVTAVNSAIQLGATVIEALPSAQNIGFGSTAVPFFTIGDLVIGQTSGARGIVAAVVGPNMTVQVISSATSTVTQGQQGGAADPTVTPGFAVAEIMVGPGGALTTTSVGSFAPLSVPIWDEEVMSPTQGYPSSVFVDQNRLGFCNFPSLPSAIGWSAVGNPFDFYPDATPQASIFELVPNSSRPLYDVPGPESSEFIFCDNAIYYVPISPTNPLRPGSVQFLKIDGGGAGAVQPRVVGDVILYADQGLNQIYSIIATGAYNRPYEIVPLTDLHAHLFNNIQAIAVPTSVTQFPERYCYVLNGDGTIALGKYVLDKSGGIAGRVGWLPWNGQGTVKWVSALNDVVIFVTAYTQGATAFMLEQLDATLYLDASLPVNAIPATLTPPGGKGPLWWLPLASVDLMDGRLPLGPHATDANGFILPITPGEDLTSATLRAGFTWTGVWEPFLPAAQPGQDVGQRLKKRRARLQAYVMDSSGFRFASLFNGERGPNRPAPGTIIGDKRIAAYNQDDDATQAPPLREQSYAYKPLGRSFDPRNAVMKDTPGPLTLVEIAARTSV